MSENASASHSVSPLYHEQINRILQEIIEVQKSHTLMLRQVLDAATKPISGKSPVALALETLVASNSSQIGAAQTLTKVLLDLPDRITNVMRAEVDRALAGS